MKDAFLGVENSFNAYRWIAKEASEEVVRELQLALDMPDVVARILASRGFNAAEAERFLAPSFKNLPDPSLLKDMDKAVSVLADAVTEDKKIAVFGDYDVDGATSSSLLCLFLKELGLTHEPVMHIPNREDGYGPNLAAMEQFVKDKIDVLVTVDCGTTAQEPLNYAKDNGLQVVVLDHHEPDVTRTPKVDALVNPKRIDEDKNNPFRNMAAVGVVFMFVVALNRELRQRGFYNGAQTGRSVAEPDVRKWLDMVAFGTVCDVVSLRGVNRLLVKSGLKYFARRNNLGLTVLADAAGVKEAPSVYHLGFVMGPRINAAGRIGNASLGACLMCTKDEIEAAQIVQKLNDMNAARKDIEAAVIAEAIEQIEAKEGEQSMAFAYNSGWHSGVIGIVAGRLKERYNLPAIVACEEDGVVHASCRSVEGIDIGLAVAKGVEQGLLVKGGGHAMAAGFSFVPDKIQEVKDFFIKEFAGQRAGQEKSLFADLEIDGLLDIGAVNLALLEKLSALEPFGAGNPEPIFALKEVGLYAVDIRGSGHIAGTLNGKGGGSVKAIAFKAADTLLGKSFLENRGELFNIAGYLRPNVWNGRTSAQFVIVDAVRAS